MSRLLFIFCTTFFLLMISSEMMGQRVYENAKLLASDGASQDGFGVSVSISGELAVVGAPNDDDNGRNSGSAYVFRFDPGTGTWNEEAKLFASDGAAWDFFGRHVAISGELAIIGAYVDDDNGYNSGSAYVFRYDSGTGTWNEEAKLLASDGAAEDYFGCSVSISNELAVIGAHGDDDNGSDSGSAFVFRFDSGTGTWNEEAKLLASDGEAWDWFSHSVSISGELAIIGACWDDDNGYESGSVYVFRFDSGTGTWNEEAKLLASDGAVEDFFGCSVSLSGEIAIIGANRDDDNGYNSGSAYVFRFDPGTGTWNEEAKLFASDGAAEDFLGSTVSISGELAIIGACQDDDNGYNSGSAYVFRFDPGTGTWIEEAKLLASDGAASDTSGVSVSTSGELALIGAYRDDDNGLNSGSAYLFDLCSGMPLFSLYFNPVPIFAGQRASFTTTNGTPDTRTFLAYCFDGPGSTFVPGLNVTLDLTNPILYGTARTNSDGNATRVPLFQLANPGQTIWFQAAQFSQVTNVVSTTVQ
jgi:hypothetical protein